MKKKLDDIEHNARSFGVSHWDSEEWKACNDELRKKTKLVNGFDDFLDHVVYDEFEEKLLTYVDNCFLDLACAESAFDLIYTIVRCFPLFILRLLP